MARTRRAIRRTIGHFLLSLLITALVFSFIFKNVLPYKQRSFFPADTMHIVNADIIENDHLSIFHPNIQDLSSVPEQKSNNIKPEQSYFSASSLSERPYVLEDIDQAILQDFHPASIDRLIFRLLISEYGDVDKIIVEQADLSNDLLPILEQAFMKLRFSPGRIEGEAVPTMLRIEVRLNK